MEKYLYTIFSLREWNAKREVVASKSRRWSAHEREEFFDSITLMDRGEEKANCLLANQALSDGFLSPVHSKARSTVGQSALEYILVMENCCSIYI